MPLVAEKCSKKKTSKRRGKKPFSNGGKKGKGTQTISGGGGKEGGM